MNSISKTALEFADRADKYYINNYSFGVQCLTDLAKNGLDARTQLINAIEQIKKLTEEIARLEAQLNEKDSL
jgi:lipid II:glycine glycyltransferase (peptidoglycan interpeptide bridge formation enzyme)